MIRQEKGNEIELLKKKMISSSIAILSDNNGLTVADITKLRVQLRKENASLKVSKNTLAKKAIVGTTHETLAPYFKGPTMLVTTEHDPVQSAKVLVKFAEDNEKFTLKAGFLDGKLMSVKELVSLSKLPSREELLAKLLGSMQAPAQNLVNVLAAIPRQLVTVLAAIRDKKQ